MIDLIQGLAAVAWAGSILGSALCSGIETGVYTLNRVRLGLRAARTVPVDHAARIIRTELERPERLLATLLIGNNVVHYLSAESMHAFLHPFGMSEGVQAAVNALLIAPVLFIAGESVPKELFRVRAESLTYRCARALWFLRWTLTCTGVLAVVRAFVGGAERLAGLSAAAVGDARQQISTLLKEGASHGVLSESQVTLLDRALAFTGVTAADEMTPWSRVRAVPADADASRALRLIGDRPYARMPVIDRFGKPVGMIRLIDLHLRPREPVRLIMTPLLRVPRTTPVPAALRMLAASGARLAVVEDEAGLPVGIVTTRDLVEPLTGELGT
jgi:CBS domain containing-hemolysin-like protein